MPTAMSMSSDPTSSRLEEASDAVQLPTLSQNEAKKRKSSDACLPSVSTDQAHTPFLTKAARAKLDAGTKFFRFFVHCCCRQNDIASAFAGYCVARTLLLASGSLGSSSASSDDVGVAIPSFPVLDDAQLRCGSRLLRDVFLDGANFKIESATYSSLLSLCDGVSPSDYLASGAVNKAPSSAAALHMQQLTTATAGDKEADESSVRWSDEVVSAYKCVRDALHAASGSSSSSSSTPSSSTPSSANPPANHTTTTTSSTLLNPSISTRYDIATLLKSDMDALKYSLTEVSYTAYIRVASHSGNLSVAESLLSGALRDVNCKKKNRLFLDVLSAYCLSPPSRSLSKALEISRTLTSFGLRIGETEYGLLLAAATSAGDSTVARRLLSDLSEDVLDPDDETRSRVFSWFTSQAAKHDSQKPAEPENVTTHNDTDIGHVVSETGWDIHESFEVDSSGRSLLPCHELCSLPLSPSLSPSSLPNPPLHHQLRSIQITTKSCVDLLSMNDEIVTAGSVDGHSSNYQGGGKGGKRTLTDYQLQSRLASWNAFKAFLKSAHAPPRQPPNPAHAIRKPYTVVVDGANVGYFEKNFAGAPPHVDYQQVDWLVRDLARNGHAVLLVMHSRHFKAGAVPRGRDEEAVERWKREGILAVTPAGMNDDWFWLHAALFKGQLQHVEGVDKRAVDLPFFVSNDEMRDHNFQMLAAREMMRWKERRRVSFEFGEWEEDDEGCSATNPSKGRKKRRKVVLHFPPLFSRRIQKREGGGLFIPHHGEGNESRWSAVVPRPKAM